MADQAEFLIRRYDSIGKFLKAAKDGVDRRGGAADRPDEGWGGGLWSGAEDFDQAYNWAANGGWEPDGIVSLRNSFDDLVPKLRKFTDYAVEARPDTSGFQVDVAAYVAGEPEHMWEWVPDEQTVTRRALCLVIGHSISAGVSSRALFIRGQACVALVRALQLLGYELEIWSEESLSSWGGSPGVPRHYSTLVRLHGAGEPMDESAVEFAIGNPAWLRRLLFAAEEGESKQIRDAFGFHNHQGYGSPMAIQHADLLNADLKLDLGRNWFRDEHGDEDVARQGIEWVAAQLKELGVLDKDAVLDWDA